jgi:NADPH:quinone reductase
VKALVSSSYGPVDELAIDEVPDPVPGPDQVLIRVEAAALNPVDVRLATGEMREMMPVEHPFVLGMDAAGVVEAVGEGVTRFSPGDAVVAFTYQGAGAIAELTLANDGPGVVLRPPGVDAVRGAAIPVAGMAAVGLVDAAPIESGTSVLVVGATGGVGSFVVQLARQAGARVLATAPPDDAAYVRGLGADEVLDYTSIDTTEEALRLQPGGVHVVIDLVNAGPGLATSVAATRPGGHLVSPLGGPPTFDLDVTVTYGHVEAAEGRLAGLVDRVAAGQLRAEVGAEYAFSDSAQAVAAFVGKHTRGKVVVTF